MDVTENLITLVLQTAIKAGNAIMQVYIQPFDVEIKSDNSPLTIADKNAHTIISEGLANTGLPILSEEGVQIPYEIRKNWTEYWLVDPLDGTKEFIKKNGDFTVNIALIRDRQPVLGVVYAPVPEYVYWGYKMGSFRMKVNPFEINTFSLHIEVEKHAEKLPCVRKSDTYKVLGSKSHMNTETEVFIKNLHTKYPELSFVSRGSSLKFCTLAEGGADIYPRFGPTMEWDTAAGHAVALFAGCTVNQADNGKPILYNKESLLNPFFIADTQKVR